MHKIFVRICSCFIFDKKKRHDFRRKHSSTKRNLAKEIDSLNARIGVMNDTIAMLSRKVRGPKRTVLFLIHNIATLDSIILIIKKMCLHPDFDVVVASINRKFPGDEEYGGEEDTHRELTTMGIEHIRLAMENSWEALKIIKILTPDVIFRQSPWDGDIPEAFRTENLSFARLCYTPYYGVHITKDPEDSTNIHEDQLFHRYCWKIFVDAQTGDMFRRYSLLAGKNVVETGLCKYEYIQSVIKAQPGDQSKKEPLIIWAPHHSVGEQWFNFSTFPKIYKYVLNYVKKSRYHFVFRPHPAFYNNMIACGAMSRQEMENFYDEWNSLENTSISIHDDYAKLFAKSDAMITDGISFLASYQIANKPIIWTNNKRHRAFTDLGVQMTEGLYTVDADEIDKLDELLDQLIEKGIDPLCEKRKRFVSDYLITDDKSPSNEVVKYLSDNL